MKLHQLLIGLSLLSTGLSVAATPAHAFSLGSDWFYSFDAAGDGSGGSKYDIRGMAMKVENDKVFVALTGNTPLTGNYHAQAADKNIGWGDLFFNFTGEKFNDAQGNLFGVRFADTNDTLVAAGIYSNVSTTSVTAANVGYANLNSYYNAGFDRQNTQGNNGLQTKAEVLNYYGSGSIQTSIASGNKIGDITMLFAKDLKATGLNFGNAGGSQIFGFSFDRSLLPSGSFLANVFLECGNDGVAIKAETATAVPEPTTMAGIALAGVGFAGARRRRRQQA